MPALALGVAMLLLTGLAGCGDLGGEVRSAASPLPTRVSPPPGTVDPATRPELSRFYAQTVQWSSCHGSFQCATVLVPQDWDQPDGATLRLAMLRLRAGGRRLGSLVINPGGPGASGVEYAKVARNRFGASVREHFDIVGFDPRGTAGSSPVACLPADKLDAFFASDATPRTQAEEQRFFSEERAWAAACQTHTGALLAHLDTRSVARDLDVIRAVLGDATLSYFGASYGTYLGAWYAQLFPWRVGRLVLDGAVNPESTAEQYSEGQAKGFSGAIKAYLQNCLNADGCPLRGTADEAMAQLVRLAADARDHPLRTDGSRKLTAALFLYAVGVGAYTDELWPSLTMGLQQAVHGDGTGLLSLADEYLGRDGSGHYDETLIESSATFCLDHGDERSVDQMRADAARWGQEYPPLGAQIGWGGFTCKDWPIPAVLTPQKLSAVGAAPILVVGNTGDPATPYAWAQALASQLTSGRLLTWDGEGHTSYRRGSRCIDAAVENYLIGGVLPGAGTVCGARS